MTKALTIRTDEETLERLDSLAERQKRSRNYLANQALQAYLYQVEGESASAMAKAQQVPAVASLEELASDAWPEEDTGDFLAYLKAEREQSLIDDTKRG
jgi:predicted DNA-binding protein